MVGNIEYFGNYDLLKCYKTAFLCSRKIPATAVLKSYDWAISMREEKKCVISGFHGPLEKEVLDILIKGDQPIIVALAKNLPVKFPLYFQDAFKNGRILMISNFHGMQVRPSVKTARRRNKLMLELCDKIVVGYCSKQGQLSDILRGVKKPIEYLVS